MKNIECLGQVTSSSQCFLVLAVHYQSHLKINQLTSQLAMSFNILLFGLWLSGRCFCMAAVNLFANLLEFKAFKILSV